MKRKKLMIEKDSPRGLVPTSAYGIQDVEYDTYLESLKIREDGAAIRQALAASTDPRFTAFLERVGKPIAERRSLASLAKGCDISLPQFAEFWQKAQHMRALAKAQDGVVELTGDLVEDARRQWVSCDRCDGFGWVFSDPGTPGNYVLDPTAEEPKEVRQCPQCKGEKRLPKVGDADARRMLLEMAGHTGKGRGVAVQINNYGGATMESAVDRLNVLTVDVAAEDAE